MFQSIEIARQAIRIKHGQATRLKAFEFGKCVRCFLPAKGSKAYLISGLCGRCRNIKEVDFEAYYNLYERLVMQSEIAEEIKSKPKKKKATQFFRKI